MRSNNVYNIRNLAGDRSLLIQYTEGLEMDIIAEEWTQLRIEMAQSLRKEDRLSMPGIKRAEIVQRPQQQKLYETPTVIISIEGIDGLLYEWEGTIQMTDRFEIFGQVHVMSAPESDFEWKPDTTGLGKS